MKGYTMTTQNQMNTSATANAPQAENRANALLSAYVGKDVSKMDKPEQKKAVQELNDRIQFVVMR